MQYNPDVHSSVVNNLRTSWKVLYPTRLLTLTDTQVWECFEQGYGSNPGEGEVEDDHPELKGMEPQEATYILCMLDMMEC